MPGREKSISLLSGLGSIGVVKALLVVSMVGLLFLGCSGGGSGSGSDSLPDGLADKLPDGLPDDTGGVEGNYHPAGWVNNAQHGADFNSNPQNCKACHGDDLNGGESGVSCLLCHHGVGGPYPGHTGKAPHNSPGDCDGCHGADFNGAAFDGLAVPSCFECHADRVSMKAGVPDHGACAKSGCHPDLQSHPSHTGGNNRGPSPLDCEECHTENPFIYDTYADGLTLALTGVCDSCHSPMGAFDGVDDGTIGAKSNWSSGVYTASGTLGTGREKWCAGCHDDAPAFSKPTPIEVIVDNQDAGASFTGTWSTSTFAPGFFGPDYHYHLPGAGNDTFTWTPTISTAGPYTVYGRWTSDPSRAPDATYTIHHDGPGSPTDVVVNQRANGGAWVFLGTFNFDGSGDFVELTQEASGYVIADAIKFESGGPATFAPNITGDNTTYGFYVSGHNINCLGCHDAFKKHIDGEHRTYEAGVNPYGASYRLRDINGQPAMNIPRPLYAPATNPLANADDFALCFDCHNRFEVMTQTGVPGKSNFWNNDASPGNSHNIHLGIYTIHFDSDWNGLADSSESCIACHNVHGSKTRAMIRSGELISTHGTMDKAPALNFAYLVSPLPGTRDPDATLKESVGGNMNLAGATIPQNGVCGACHGAISYQRDPYLGPRVVYPQATPDMVDVGGGSQNVLLSAIVTDPDDAIPGGVAVTVDLSSISAGVQNMINQGNGLYAYWATVPGATDPGQYFFVVTADDGLNTGENTILLRVTQPGIEIVDNLDTSATFTGTWGVATFAPGFFGLNYHYHAAGAGSDTFTWTPTINTRGMYEVFARWTQDPSRANDATYTVFHDGGNTPVVVDQRSNGGVWYSLGSFSLDGVGDKIELVQSASGIVVADAIEFVLQ